jgi:uncharacterized repeat protein (TIGR03803 family)
MPAAGDAEVLEPQPAIRRELKLSGGQHQGWKLDRPLHSIQISVVLVLALAAFFEPVLHGQTFTVLYDFTGGIDGARPGAGMSMDNQGTFYGSTQYGGNLNCDAGGLPGCGVVFQFKKFNSTWKLSTLHTFYDGSFPTYPGVPSLSPDGSLYTVTFLGGKVRDGTIFDIPGPVSPTPYRVIYQFAGPDGDGPTRLAPLLFDSAGNIYGATSEGGITGSGVVYELKRLGASWTESVLYGFTGGSDGSHLRGVTFDDQGNLYGVAAHGGGNQDCDFGLGCGTIYKLTHSQSGWTEMTLHTFQQGVDGGWPGPLIRDKAGNLYGMTEQDGPDNSGGTVWELSPDNGGWTFSVLHAFPATTVNDFGPYPLTMDAAGNLYGITNWGGANNEGILFRLTHTSNGWSYSDLHDFGPEACTPQGAVIIAAGEIYGIAEACGKLGHGAIWKFTP